MIANIKSHPSADETTRAIAAWRGCRDDDAASWPVHEYRELVAGIAARLPHWWLVEDSVEETFTRAHRHFPERAPLRSSTLRDAA